MNEMTPFTGGPMTLPLPAAATPVDLTVSRATADFLTQWELSKQRVALHESAHAVVARHLGLPVVAATIRKRSGGAVETEQDGEGQPQYLTASMMRASITARLAGSVAEQLILGEGSSGGMRDLEDATTAALEIISAGLDPAAPFISLDAFGYGNIPDWLKDERARAVQAILASAREEAAELVARYEPAVKAFAVQLWLARRLEGAALEAAFVAAGMPAAAEA